jgi:hypothetical protein
LISGKFTVKNCPPSALVSFYGAENMASFQHIESLSLSNLYLLYVLYTVGKYIHIILLPLLQIIRDRTLEAHIYLCIVRIRKEYILFLGGLWLKLESKKYRMEKNPPIDEIMTSIV